MTMRQMIRKARKLLREMSDVEKINLMVRAGVMTPAQAAKAEEKLLENDDTLP